MAKLPYMQFYPADWLIDTQVLPLSAKGAWIDILCLLWVSDTPGVRTFNIREFTTLLRLQYDEEIDQTIADLSRVADITLTDEHNQPVKDSCFCAWITIKSRRIVRDRESLNARKDSYKRYNHKRTTRKPHTNHTKTTERSQKSYIRSHTSESEEEKRKKEETPIVPLQGTTCVVSDFDDFWAAYPKKTGKKAALQAWLKAKDKPKLVDIVQAIEKQKDSPQWKKEHGQFIPNPSTWLNQGRWADTPVEVTGMNDPNGFLAGMHSFLERHKHEA